MTRNGALTIIREICDDALQATDYDYNFCHCTAVIWLWQIFKRENKARLFLWILEPQRCHITTNTVIRFSSCSFTYYFCIFEPFRDVPTIISYILYNKFKKTHIGKEE